MRAAQLRGARDVAVVEIPRPLPGPGEVVVRIAAALTCGTDAKVFRRGYHARMLHAPCLFGHEYAGVIEAVGHGVRDFRPGDDVVGANSAPCGICEYCHEGREALCDDLLFVNGAFAEWLLVPARVVTRNLYHRPDGLRPAEAAGVDPVACVLKGVDVVAPRSGQIALILGAGPVAVVFAQALAVHGMRSLIFARSEETAAVARAAGVDDVLVSGSVREAEGELLLQSRDSRGFDLVVEAAGAAETSQAAPRLARKGGRVLLFGGCSDEAAITVSPARLHYDEIDILSSFHHTPRHVRAALEALAGGTIRLSPLLEDPVSLDGVATALERMNDRTLRRKVPVLPHG